MNYKNFELHPVIEFLNHMKLPGRASLGRSALKKVLLEKQDAFQEEQIEIVDTFEGWIDKEELVFVADNKELNEANKDLKDKDIDVTVDSPFFNDLITALKEYDEEVSGNHADAYAKLYEELVEEEK